MTTLFHVHDPMCSWCWAYRPVLQELLASLNSAPYKDIDVRHLVGGLAPDSDQPMPQELREHLQGIWRRIQQVVPGTEFNFDFWTKNTPRRSTWPSCRAVLAAETLAGSGEAMTQAIQQAYYLEARNPSDASTLIALAEALGIDGAAFAECLTSAETESHLQADFQLAHRIGAQGFPSLFLVTDDAVSRRLSIDYGSAQTTLAEIAHYRTN